MTEISEQEFSEIVDGIKIWKSKVLKKNFIVDTAIDGQVEVACQHCDHGKITYYSLEPMKQ